MGTEGNRTGRPAFCARCGSPLREGDRFCSECGTAVPGVAGDPDEPTQASPPSGQAEEFFAQWDRQDEANTETIPTSRPGDTAVLPAAPAEPYLPPGGPPAAPPAAPVQPSQAYPPTPPPPRERFSLGATIALLGAVAIIVSALLPWGRQATVGGVLVGSVSPRDVPIEALLDPGGPATDPSLGLVLLGAGVVGALVALITMVVPVLKFLRRLIGLATLALPGLFVFRTVQAAIEASATDRILSVLGVGVYVAAAGAFTQMVAGRWFRR